MILGGEFGRRRRPSGREFSAPQARKFLGIDAMVVGDPANMNWLTGFDAWSFYVPQVMVVESDRLPVWIGRAMDAGAVGLTTHLDSDCIVPYPEELVQRDDTHPSTFMAHWLSDRGLGGKRLGYESDSFFFSPRALIFRAGRT